MYFRDPAAVGDGVATACLLCFGGCQDIYGEHLADVGPGYGVGDKCGLLIFLFFGVFLKLKQKESR